MANILDYGAGASKGLDAILEQKIREQVQARADAALAETGRSNRADEDIRRETIKESQITRREASDRILQDKSRDDARAEVSMMPRGSRMTGDQIAGYTKRGIPPQMFELDQLQSATNPDFVGPEQEPGGIFQGTATMQQADDRIKQAEQRIQDAQARAADQQEMARLRQDLSQEREDRLRSWGPPVVTIADPNNPGASRIVGRDKIPDEGAVAPVPAAVQGDVLKNETAEAQLDRLEAMFDDGAGDMIGPIEGRARSFGQKVPGIEVDPQFADFNAASESFKNAVIKAITGAQLQGSAEQTRIMAQIPKTSDKPEVWRAAAKQTRLNLQDLAKRIGARQGGGAPAAPTGARRIRYDMDGNEIP